MRCSILIKSHLRHCMTSVSFSYQILCALERCRPSCSDYLLPAADICA